MEEGERVSFEASQLKLVITSTKYDELYILSDNTTRIYFKRRRRTSSSNILRFCLLNPSKTKANLNYTRRFISQLAETTLRLGYKNLSVNVV